MAHLSLQSRLLNGVDVGVGTAPHPKAALGVGMPRCPIRLNLHSAVQFSFINRRILLLPRSFSSKSSSPLLICVLSFADEEPVRNSLSQWHPTTTANEPMATVVMATGDYSTVLLSYSWQRRGMETIGKASRRFLANLRSILARV